MDKTEFSKRLQEERTNKGFTQEQMAEKLGISRSAYANYETGLREPKLISVSRLADILQVNVDWLLGRTEVKDVYPRG